MFIGHFAVGFGSKRWAPETSLGPLLLAPVLPDVLWPVFCLLGIERFRIMPGESPFALSHWVLEWITHGPDLPLWPRSDEVPSGRWKCASRQGSIPSSLFAIPYLNSAGSSVTTV
jgi:hypothetical protein